VFGGVLLVLYGLRKRATGWVSAQPGIAPPAALFAHPVSAAVIITAALTRVLQPYAPSSVYDLAWAAALVPLWLLLPTLLGAAARRQASGLLALFVLNAVLQAVLGNPILLRLASIALALLAAAVLLTVLRSRAAPGRTSGWWRPLLLATRVGLVALVAAIGANVLGFVELSGLLVRSTINIGTATIWLMGVAAILGGVYVVVVEALLARRLRAVRSHQARLVRHGLAVIHALAILLWFVVAARQLQILAPVLDAVRAVLRREWSIGSWSPSLEEVLVFAVAIWVTVTVAAVTRALLREDVLPRMGLGRGPADAASSLVFYAAMALGLLFAIGAAGLQLSQLAFIVGALGVGIGFGLQNIVGNFISGLILLFERPIQVDDTIELGSLLGNVKAIGIRASIVRTFEGAEVIVPNSDLIAGRVVNWTLSDQKRRMEVTVGVARGTPPSRVLEILRSVPARHPRVLAEPAPLALFAGFGESSLDFVLWFWTANFGEWVQIRSDVYAGVYEALTEAGIKIPFPQRDLHIRSVEADAGLGGGIT
jgi:small-conductance mechanosensitive channel